MMMKDWTEIFSEKLHDWSASFLRLLPNLSLAVLIVIIAILSGKLVRRFFYKVIFRITSKISISSLFATIMQLIIVCIGFFIALDLLQLNKALSSLLAGAGIIGIILGFAFQDITSNFISGVYIAFKKPFEVGHTVKTNDFIGHIEEIQLRSTTIRTFSGLHLMIPNKEIIMKPMINYSLTQERRIELEFYISSDVDLGATHRTISAAMTQLNYLYPGKTVDIYFADFKDNAIKIAVWFWIDNHAPPGFMVARHDAIFNIMTALKEQNISLVVPLSLQNLQVPVKK